MKLALVALALTMAAHGQTATNPCCNVPPAPQSNVCSSAWVKYHAELKCDPAPQTVEATIGDGNWTVRVTSTPGIIFPNRVEVCSVLSPGTIVGGGDNCDFHYKPDPIYCSWFDKDFGCQSALPMDCGTSFGCQNLAAPVLEWIAKNKPAPQQKEPPAKPVVATYTNCTQVSESGNSEGYGTASLTFNCEEGKVMFKGRWHIIIEYGMIYRDTLGQIQPGSGEDRATMKDRSFWTWCKLNDREIQMVDFNPAWKKGDKIDTTPWYPNPKDFPDCKQPASLQGGK